MPRVKRGTLHLKKRRALRKATKGYKWSRKTSVRQGKTAVLKAGVDAYRGRREKKRNYRRLWTLRINAGARPLGMTYSQLINKLKVNNITLDRKVLADIAMNYPEVFKALVGKVK